MIPHHILLTVVETTNQSRVVNTTTSFNIRILQDGDIRSSFLQRRGLVGLHINGMILGHDWQVGLMKDQGAALSAQTRPNAKDPTPH